MRNKKQINSELADLDNFQSLTQTFTEIAASRLQRIRDSVVKNREYINGVNTIFGEVKYDYKTALERLKKSSDPNSGLRQKNGKTASVFISSNTGLYGDIVRKVFYSFLESVKKDQSDVVVIGKSGQTMLDNEGGGIKAQYFDFPDDAIDLASLKKITDSLIQYQRVIVYFGRFESVVNQTPTTFEVSGSEKTDTYSTTPRESYLVEPTLEEVLNFFETEIFASLFEQTIEESQLAKFASRMLYMDSASERIKEQIVKTEFEKQRVKHQIANKKQLQTLSSISLW